MKLNLGCGARTPAGWRNVDYALGARLAKMPLFRFVNRRLGLFSMAWDDRIELHDLTTRFPWADGSADVVYSSHTLEHMTREQGRFFLAECHRVLRTGGLIRIVVPDLEHLVRQYSQGQVRADDFVDRLGVLYEMNGRGLKSRLAPFLSHPHKCMYDTPTLLALLRETGFDAESRAGFDSRIPDIRAIEAENRVEGAVVVEGTKRRLS